MSGQTIRYDDGAAYERGMGSWTQSAGHVFLDWIAPQAGLRWVDVGCGTGAFTELLIQRCAPSAVSGIDPSPA
jgi:trans-aconitate methyltransferase